MRCKLRFSRGQAAALPRERAARCGVQALGPELKAEGATSHLLCIITSTHRFKTSWIQFPGGWIISSYGLRTNLKLSAATCEAQGASDGVLDQRARHQQVRRGRCFQPPRGQGALHHQRAALRARSSIVIHGAAPYLKQKQAAETVTSSHRYLMLSHARPSAHQPADAIRRLHRRGHALLADGRRGGLGARPAAAPARRRPRPRFVLCGPGSGSSSEAALPSLCFGVASAAAGALFRGIGRRVFLKSLFRGASLSFSPECAYRRPVQRQHGARRRACVISQ